MKTIILFILAISAFNSSISFAQTKNDSIATKPFLGGYIYKKDGSNMTIGKLNKVLKTDSEANNEWKIAKKYNISTFVMGCIAGGFLGLSLPTYGRSEVNFTQLFLGVGIFGLSIPFQRIGNRHTKKAVDLYNANLK